MLSKEDFIWQEKGGTAIKASKVKLESVYSPSCKIEVKDPLIKQAAKRVLAIKTYKITFSGYESFIDIVEFIGDNGVIEQFYNGKSHDHVYAEGYDFGELHYF